jgi:hypothetical protein
METPRVTGHENDFPAGQPPRRSARKHRRVFQLMAVLWSILFLATLANTEVGALFMRDTWPALVLTMGALLLCLLLVLIGIGLTVVRRSWTPLLMSAVKLVVSVFVCYATLVLVLNVPVIELIRGKPAIVSVYVGTQNSAILTLRRNGTMDVFWHGWPGTTMFYDGTFQLHEADLRLHFGRGQGPERLSDRAVVGANEVKFFGTDDRRPLSFRIVHAEPGAMPR